jgi:hypothetical protein
MERRKPIPLLGSPYMFLSYRNISELILNRVTYCYLTTKAVQHCLKDDAIQLRKVNQQTD